MLPFVYLDDVDIGGNGQCLGHYAAGAGWPVGASEPDAHPELAHLEQALCL